MPDTFLIDPGAATDKLPTIDGPPPGPGMASGEFFQPQHQKTDAEAVQDWESEGGGSSHPSEG